MFEYFAFLFLHKHSSANSAPFRPLITLDPGHPLRSIAATYYGDSSQPWREMK
jgi:hypothetical protein